jgi:hypothetical protein
MYKISEIKFPLVLIISFALHLILILGIIAPDFGKIASFAKRRTSDRSSLFIRDIIVNLNQDDRREINRQTLLSDRDSTAKGYITRKPGDRWLNNSLDFKIFKGSKGSAGSSSGEKNKNLLQSLESEIEIAMNPGKFANSSVGQQDRIQIPDKNGVTKENALYYSNSGMFSFNTAKFKNFHYFKNMKDRIASNWYPPLMANAILGGYAPGYTRIMAIQSQEVKLVFVLNRMGDVMDVVILDSLGNKTLDISCSEAIRMSKNFGKVPDDIQGDPVVIPFIFGYYVY